MRYWLLVIASVLALTGCSASIEDYESETPKLKLEEFFVGELVAYGTVEDFKGKVIQRFKVDITGEWDGNEGTLDEKFYYADGSEQTRLWYLTKTGENTYEGRASDVEGVAEGTTAGNALNWVYVLEVEVDGEPLKVKLDDWLFLIDEDNMINRTQMYKYGLPVGEITLYIGRK